MREKKKNSKKKREERERKKVMDWDILESTLADPTAL